MQHLQISVPVRVFMTHRAELKLNMSTVEPLCDRIQSLFPSTSIFWRLLRENALLPVLLNVVILY